MMRVQGKTFIHVGLPRTGSTFLQKRLFPLLEGVSYQEPILDEAVTATKGVQPMPSLADYAPGPNVTRLLSSEGYSMDPWVQEYNLQLGKVKEIFDDVEVIVCLREPLAWLESIYALSIQKGRYQLPEDFFGWEKGAFVDRPKQLKDRKTRIDVRQVNFSGYLSYLYDTFGRDRTHVFYFEDFRSDQPAMLQKLCALLGTTVPDQLDLSRENASMSSADIARKVEMYRRVTGMTGGLPGIERIGRSIGIRMANGLEKGASGKAPDLLPADLREGMAKALEHERWTLSELLGPEAPAVYREGLTKLS